MNSRVAGPPRVRWRLVLVGAALAATVPVWPIVQPGEPIADEMLSPAEVAVIVPIVLLFPVAWALLGRSRRVGFALVGCVFAWSVGTVRLATYASPPNVDDALRWYLVVAGVLVGAAAVASPDAPVRRRVAGVVVWLIGWCATAAVPFVGSDAVPPRDAVLPLPATMTVTGEEAPCETGYDVRYCLRTLTIAATDGVRVEDLARRLGRHLEQAKGWTARWYDFTPDPDFECRPARRLADPYRLCIEMRVEQSTVTVHMGYANRHDPIYG